MIVEMEFDKYIKGAMRIASNLRGYFEDADCESKQALVGSIFPGRLIYEKNRFRTPKLNTFLALISNKNNKIINPAENSTGLHARKVAHTGIEPVLQP